MKSKDKAVTTAKRKIKTSLENGMQWLSKNTISEAARKSDQAALDCTIKHWEQLHSVSIKTYWSGWQKGLVSMTEHHCALCLRHMYDTPCPLKGEFCDGECLREWRHAYNAETEEDWEKATGAMLAKLRAIKLDEGDN